MCVEHLITRLMWFDHSDDNSSGDDDGGTMMMVEKRKGNESPPSLSLVDIVDRCIFLSIISNNPAIVD